jgi:hypothetical protein
MLILFLVANRSQIYYGSQEALNAEPSKILQASPGNEFIYGAGTIVHYDITNQFSWGARYLITVFIRPIPRGLWPSKYDDAARWFNLPSMEENLGSDFISFGQTLGWEGTVGASPTLIPDLWMELSWFCVLALFAIGWAHAKMWRLAVDRGGVYTPLYILLMSLSLYLVMQTLEASLYRFLFMSVPTMIIWRVARTRPQPAGLGLPLPTHFPGTSEKVTAGL